MVNKVILPAMRNIAPNIIASEICSVQPMTKVEMKIGEMSHACSTWYWAAPEYNPGEIFELDQTRQRYADINAWVEEMCGPPGAWSDLDCRWWKKDRKYIFKNEKDRMMFVLKWL